MRHPSIVAQARESMAARRSIELPLSAREREVFQLMGAGRRTRKIAELLSLSPKTIQTYHARIKRKLHIEDHTELLCEAARRHARKPNGTA